MQAHNNYCAQLTVHSRTAERACWESELTKRSLFHSMLSYKNKPRRARSLVRQQLAAHVEQAWNGLKRGAKSAWITKRKEVNNVRSVCMDERGGRGEQERRKLKLTYASLPVVCICISSRKCRTWGREDSEESGNKRTRRIQQKQLHLQLEPNKPLLLLLLLCLSSYLELRQRHQINK